jgi:hypothetical protein
LRADADPRPPQPGARSTAPAIRPRAASAGRIKPMAKGQQKSNREAKKPKKEKPKAVATANSGASSGTIDRIKGKKK